MPVTNHSANLAESIVAALKGDAGVSALVGGRVFGGMAVQDSALPRIVFHDIASATDYTHDSATTDDPGVEDSLIQFDIEADTLSGCRTVTDAIAGLFSGAVIHGEAADIQGAFKEPGGITQSLPYDSGRGVTEAHRQSVTYRFLWRDA